MSVVTEPTPAVEVSPPHVCLYDVPVAHGQRFGHTALTLEQARALRDLLTVGIDRYLAVYGEATG